MNEILEKIKQFFNEKKYRYIYLAVILLIIFIFTFSLTSSNKFSRNIQHFLYNVGQFFEQTELKTHDLRCQLPNRKIKANPDIVILAIDDTSLEVLEEQYGRYPWKRGIYADVIEYMQAGKVDSIAFDLMFLGYREGAKDQDLLLASTLGKYKNTYVSMNFDVRDTENPPDISEALKYTIENKSPNIDFKSVEFTNCRLIFDDILKQTDKIGIINFFRDTDGISRRINLFFKYKDSIYPYLAFKVSYDYIQRHEHPDNIDSIKNPKVSITKNNEVTFFNRKLPVDDNGAMLLNWYGPSRTFLHIPFWQVMKSINDVKKGKEPLIPAEYFEDKIVFVGVTATSLFDIKTTPLDRIYPGVELQSTVFNNIIDNNPTKRVKPFVDFAICIILIVMTAVTAIKVKSSITTSVMTVLITAFYIILACYLFKEYFIWVGLVNPVISIILTFTVMYIIKYLLKSRDFEHTYKLATTDGLTNLYNHRYFQDEMLRSIEKANKTKGHFTLVLVDIDFFKKFNDTYGHQAGDAVLKQVAETLKKSVRPGDLVARYGGEEMAIIFAETDIEEGIKLADNICKIIAAKPFKLSDTVEKHVTISLGVATYPQCGLTPTELIEFSDQGLYRAKEGGRNQVGAIGELPDLKPLK